MSLSSNKACGPSSISTSLLKTLKGVLSIPLQLLFNCSFSTGLVPDQFKVARVVPIHKKGSSFLVSNYRPISLLSIFNKVLEKLMYNRIISYLAKFSVVHNNQFGFRSKNSTTHALLLLTDKIQRPIDNGTHSTACADVNSVDEFHTLRRRVVRRVYTIFLRARSKKMRDSCAFVIQFSKFPLYFIVVGNKGLLGLKKRRVENGKFT